MAVRAEWRLRLVLGEHDLLMRAGEAAEFDTAVPHFFDRSGSGAVELLVPSVRRASGCTCGRGPGAPSKSASGERRTWPAKRGHQYQDDE